MKKFILLFLATVVVSCSEETITDSSVNELEKEEILTKSSSPINLVKSWTAKGGYRGYSSYSKGFTVEVSNLGFEKKISAYHEKIDGSWEEIPLNFEFSINEEKELWVGAYEEGGFGLEPKFADEFVIKYEVNGTTYWDNNNGQNYSMTDNGSLFAKPDLNVSVDPNYVTLFYDSYSDVTRFNIAVDVKNIAPEKEVGVLYTTDNWETQKYVPLNFIRWWYYGYTYFVESPNEYGVERWIGNVDLDKNTNTVEYAVVYKVNGQEYWDNNYKRNYIVEKDN